MGRAVVIIFCVFCVATVLSEGAGLALLWSRGQLTLETVHDITALLRGPVATKAETNAETISDQPTTAEVVEQRVLRTLDLGAREDELKLLKALISERQAGLLAEKSALEKQKADFDAQWKRLQTDITSEATEQARSVLLELEPEGAVANLLSLDLKDNLRLLQGVPPRALSEILTAFEAAGPEGRKRGGEIFKALSEGEPMRSVLDGRADNAPAAAAPER